MADLAQWAFPAAMAFGLAGAMVVAVAALLHGRRAGPRPVSRRRGKAIEMRCGVCRRQLVFYQSDLAVLSATEKALTVRAVPKTAGRPVAEYTCPYCESALCFLTDTKPPQCIGENLYIPETESAVCLECRTPLVRPPWPPGGAPEGNQALHPNYGLVCPFCKSVCCVTCCLRATRNRSPAGTYVCPRCSRQSLTEVFHPDVPRG